MIICTYGIENLDLKFPSVKETFLVLDPDHAYPRQIEDGDDVESTP